MCWSIKSINRFVVLLDFDQIDLMTRQRICVLSRETMNQAFKINPIRTHVLSRNIFVASSKSFDRNPAKQRIYKLCMQRTVVLRTNNMAAWLCTVPALSLEKISYEGYSKVRPERTICISLKIHNFLTLHNYIWGIYKDISHIKS